ncbi:MAG: LytR/AlgR family response regulator transcription factor [Bacteroidota bacterium]
MTNPEITAIIVEDVVAYLNTVEKLITQYTPQVRVVGKCTTLAEASLLIKKYNPELLFLDIQFEEEGRTAFDLLNELDQKSNFRFQIIFITAHREKDYYAMAFEYGALQFLEKPIDAERLIAAVDRVMLNFLNRKDIDWMSQVKQLHRMWYQGLQGGRLVVEGTRFTEVVDMDSVVLLEASGRYTIIHLCDGKAILSSRNLGDYEKRLESAPGFLRIHHSRIINLNYVKRYSRKERIIELNAPIDKQVASKDRFRFFLKAMEGCSSES